MKRILLAVVGLVLLVGCTPAQPTPTPLPEAPGWYSGPWNREVAEMVGIYEAYFAAFTALEAAGGAEQLPDEFRKWLIDPAFSSCERYLSGLWSDGYQPDGESSARTVQGTQMLDGFPHEAELSLTTCEEYVDAFFIDGNGNTKGAKGPSFMEWKYYFRSNSEGSLRLFDTDAEWVQSC